MLRVSVLEVLLGVLLLLIHDYLPVSFPYPTLEDVLPQTIKREEAVVTRVVDGDTLSVKLDGKDEKVRLIGIDTPETVDRRQEIECFGKEATLAMKKMVENKKILLESDTTQDNRDRYRRLLRYVFLPDGIFVNQRMIENGFAYEYTYETSYRYQKEFKLSEAKARNEGTGLWSEDACSK